MPKPIWHLTEYSAGRIGLAAGEKSIRRKEGTMKKLFIVASLLCLSAGCSSVNSPYDLHTWCLQMGAARLTSSAQKLTIRSTVTGN